MKLLLPVLCLVLFTKFQAQKYSADQIPDVLRNGAKAVIREHSEDYTLKDIQHLSIIEKHAVTILNKAGDDFAVVAIPYNPTTNVGSIKVNLYDGRGKLSKTFTKKDFSDYTQNSSSALYLDDRILVLKVTAVNYPYTVESQYETNTSNTVYLSMFRPIESYDIALEKSSFKLNNLSGIKVRTKVTDTDIAKVRKNETPTNSEYIYENIPAVKEEDMSPSLEYLMPRVEFSPEHFTLAKNQGNLTDWNSFGKWYYSNLINPVSEITPEIAKEIASLQLAGTTHEKVKKIYQYMQAKTRYVLIKMGIGGWQPMPAAEVSKKGYGDCKALTNYMRTLLAAAGIKSYFAVIYSDDTQKRYDQDFPKLAGNHAILVVPTEQGNIWLENTSQNIAFNHLGFDTLFRNALAIHENGIFLMDTPVYKPQDSEEILKGEIRIKTDNTVESKVNFVFSGGQYDQKLRYIGIKDEVLKNHLKERHSFFKTTDFAVANLKNNRDDAELSFELDFKARDFAKKLGDDFFFPVMPFYGNMLLSASQDRKLPFETPFPYHDDYTLDYIAPDGYKFAELPSSQELKTQFGDYTLSFKADANKITVHRTLTVNKGLYPKEQYNDYVAFLKKIAYHDNTKILLTKH